MGKVSSWQHACLSVFNVEDLVGQLNNVTSKLGGQAAGCHPSLADVDVTLWITKSRHKELPSVHRGPLG